MCLYGTISYGDLECKQGVTAFTRVSSYKDWIQKTLVEVELILIFFFSIFDAKNMQLKEKTVVKNFIFVSPDQIIKWCQLKFLFSFPPKTADVVSTNNFGEFLRKTIRSDKNKE